MIVNYDRKTFIVQVTGVFVNFIFLHCGLYYKGFTIVIYDHNDSTIIIYNHNDSGQYYKTINYNPRVIIYDPSLSNY
jgi:hypothetical protein